MVEIEAKVLDVSHKDYEDKIFELENQLSLSGFLGNSIVVFVAKELDFLVLINYILYYVLISYIVNRKKYDTILGKFIVLPGSAAGGAFAGYKLSYYLLQLL